MVDQDQTTRLIVGSACLASGRVVFYIFFPKMFAEGEHFWKKTPFVPAFFASGEKSGNKRCMVRPS